MTHIPYPEYKESGIEWLGSIPAAWNVGKFRYVFTESSEVNGAKPVGEMLSVSGYRGVEIKVYDDENRKRSDADLETYRVVRPGQLAVNTMWLNYAGLGVSDLTGYVSPAYRSYSIAPEVHGRYIHHLMRCGVYVNAYTGELTGIRPNSLQMNRGTLMEWPVLLPPAAEQRQISDYLDAHTAKIDALIEKQERLIQTLAERRQAVISRAVTKGLDPNTPMKDSGIEIIGHTPRHWKTLPLKRLLVRIEQGVSPQASAELAGERSWGVVKSGCVNHGVFSDVQHKRLPDDFAIDPTIVIRRGDLLVSRASGSPTLVGSAAIVRELRYQLILSDKTFRLVVDRHQDLNFIEKVMSSRLFRDQVRGAISGAEGLANNLPGSAMKQFVFPVPPVHEQHEIVAYLDRETAQIDALSAKARQMIDVLKERRQALISAAVTGKIDVRGMVSA